jgi:hypothetical protein
MERRSWVVEDVEEGGADGNDLAGVVLCFGEAEFVLPLPNASGDA